MADSFAHETNRLGRKKAADPRDRDYFAFEHVEGVMPPRRLSAATLEGETVPGWAADLPKPYRYHKRGAQLDQGQTSRCVAFAFAQLVLSGPIMQPQALVTHMAGHVIGEQPQSFDHALTLAYRYMQAHDEWVGGEPEYYGTSERAGAKWGQAAGFWPNYFWLTTAAEIARYVVLHHPVPIGTDWFTGCDSVISGYIRATGGWRGGHMWLIDGVNIASGFFRMRQSWGERPYKWAKVSFSDLEYLMGLGAGAVAVNEIRAPRTA